MCSHVREAICDRVAAKHDFFLFAHSSFLFTIIPTSGVNCDMQHMISPLCVWPSATHTGPYGARKQKLTTRTLFVCFLIFWGCPFFVLFCQEASDKIGKFS